jgi:hypothetical protein
MADRKNSSNKYRRVNPEDYYNFEDQYLDKNGTGSGGKGAGGKGAKTLKNLKRQHRRASQDQRMEELEDALCMVLDGFPDFENEDQLNEFLERYISWVENNLSRLAPLDPSQLELGFSKSGGPGGQNINKRETKVSLQHKPTQIRVVNDQTRSQADNRVLAEEQLHKRLEDHLRDWRIYLGANQDLDLQLIKELLSRDL